MKRRARSAQRLPARGLVPLAIAAMMFGVRYDADAAATRHKDIDGALVERTQGLPDLARGRQSAADGRLEDAEVDLKPLAERGYVEAQIALGKLYARIGTPDRIAAAIGWLRTARQSSPEPTEVPLGRLLVRENDEASLAEGEALLSTAWAKREDPEALAGLIRLYTEHPERDTQQRIGALIVRGERIRQPDVQGAVIGWYRATPQIDGHREKVVSLCARWLDGVPECHVDLARAARASGDIDYLNKLVKAASERYDQGILQPQTLASLARVLVEATDESAEADAVAPAALPVKISDLPEHEDEGTAASSMRLGAGGSAPRACANEPVTTAAASNPNAPATPAVASTPAPAAQPDLANGLLEKLLKGPGDAPVLAAGVVARYPYLLPGADIEQTLKQGLDRGTADARLYLGQLYLVGARAPRNPQLALQYLQQAADEPSTALQGHYFLGRLYQYGYLDESQPLFAAEHLMWAARRGYAAADGSLARLFANGKGICPNLVNAYVFARLGAREGSASTAALQQQIGAQLTQEQRSAAERLYGEELQARPSAYEIPAAVLAQERGATVDGEDATTLAAAPVSEEAAPATDDATAEEAPAIADTDAGHAVANAAPAATAPAPAPAPAAVNAPIAPAAAPLAAAPTVSSTPTASAAPTPDAALAHSEALQIVAPALAPIVSEAPAPTPPLVNAPVLTYSKSLSFIVPAEAPSAQAAPGQQTVYVAAPPTARREVRLSHKPSDDAAVQQLLQGPQEFEYQLPADAPAAAPSGHGPATPGPAPSVRVIPTGDQS